MKDSAQPERVKSAFPPPVDAGLFHLGRQPIVDVTGTLHGYELLYREGPYVCEIPGDSQATAHVIARTLGDIGVAQALSGHPGFINLGRDLLPDDAVLLLPPRHFVLELLETVRIDAEVLARLATLRHAGYRLALDDVCGESQELREALPWIDYVKVDFLHAEKATLPNLVETVRRAGRTLIAEKVESDEDVELARQLGFDLFQGFRFAPAQVLAVPAQGLPASELDGLLALLDRGAETAALEAEVRRHPCLLAQLQRLAEAASVWRHGDACGASQVLQALGRDRAACWIRLLKMADASAPAGILRQRKEPKAALRKIRTRYSFA